MKFYNLTRIIVFFSIFCFMLPIKAEDRIITITPTEKISTANKNLLEGDIVGFKDVDSKKELKGTIRKITPNGFMGKQASLIIDNIHYINSNDNYSAKIYINGNEHETYQDLADIGIAPTFEFIRGGEVILTPEKTKLTTILNNNNKKDIPIKIAAEQRISTAHNEIEINDKLKFKVVDDVYKNNKLYIKKNSTIYGIVDYITENGWAYDNAEIDIKCFKVKTIDNKIITINYPIKINGFEILKYKGKRFVQFFNYIGVNFRGKEIDIIPKQDKITFTLWLN